MFGRLFCEAAEEPFVGKRCVALLSGTLVIASVTTTQSLAQTAAETAPETVAEGAGQASVFGGKVPSAAEQDAAIERAIEFFRLRGQAEDGSFSGQTGVAVTSLVVQAVLQQRPSLVDSPWIKQALRYIESNVRPDGGIYAEGSKYRNYETSVAISALVRANRDDRYDSELSRAEAFLKGIQWDEGEGIESSDTRYGGAGYGTHSRPDLSNTSFMVDALKDLGRDGDDPAIEKALAFITRTQNLSGHGNDTPHADKINDGGFYYTPAAGGETKAGQADGGGLRSYGSMTYAGLKSMIFAGLRSDDPRVLAAMDFIQNHYSLDTNPGMGAAGLYYYYHTFAKALDAAEIDVLRDADGETHRWRDELVTALLARQQADGSWVNRENDRWMEGDRQLVTAYALLALNYAQAD